MYTSISAEHKAKKRWALDTLGVATISLYSCACVGDGRSPERIDPESQGTISLAVEHQKLQNR